MKMTKRICLLSAAALLLMCFGCNKKETAVEEPEKQIEDIRANLSADYAEY